MTTVVLNLKDNEMTKDELNKLVMSASSVKIQAPKKRRRSKNGEPKPYWDGARAKHPGYFIDAKGKKHKVIGTGATLDQATQSRDRKLEQLRRSLSMSDIPTELITVESYCMHWLNEVANGKTQFAPKTYAGYLNAIRRWIGPYIGEIELVNLTRQDIRQLYNSMANLGLSRSSENQVHAVLNQTLANARYDGLLQNNPLAGYAWLLRKVFATAEGVGL
jgi:hypothetical protein